MINYIYMDRSGHKKARPVKTRKEYFAIRNTEANVRNFRLARDGDKKAKAKLKQFNYNDLLPDGVLKGCCHSASTFAHDIDCGKEEACREIAQRLLAKKDEIGLLELTVSSGWGLHAVCRREPGKTIVENQVRLATVTETEMDTSAHDQPRVMYTGPATDDVLLYLDDAIFEEGLTEEESAKEYARLKEREKQGKEDVPRGAKKANKHYRPWEEASDKHGQTRTVREIPHQSDNEVRVCQSQSDANILDIGTGSGCIAITLALELPDAKVTAWDISDDALRIASANAKALGASVTFQHHDALDSSLFTLHSSLPKWDFIVSNPPYICRKEADGMDKNVLGYEPHEALFVPDDDPLLFYRAIARYATLALKPNGKLFFEINPLYADDLTQLLGEMLCYNAEILNDQFGKPRFLKATKI